MSTLVQLLQQKAESAGDTAAFIFRDRHYGRQELSWQTLYKLGGHFAASLRRRGLGRGDLVINTLPNSPERVVCEAGIWLSGTGSVNGACHLAVRSDLLKTIQVSRASAILLDPDAQNSPWKVLKDLLKVGEHGDVTSSIVTSLKKIYFVRRVQGQGQGDFITQLEKESDWFQANVTPDDIISAFTTSGSTGFSKFVVYTHKNFIEWLPEHPYNLQAPCQQKTVELNISPLGWITGYTGMIFVMDTVRVLCDMRSGTPSNMAKFVWKCIQEENCSIGFFPPMYLPLVAQLARDQHEIKKMNHFLLGGLPINQKMMEAVLTISHEAIISYGATDFLTISTMNVTDSENYVDHDTGLPIEGVSIKIVRPDDESQVLGINQLGTILVQKRKVHQGYLNNAKANAEAFTEDGLYRTGDIGYIDDRGHLIVEGRSQDAIIRGTGIIYPAWLENCIQACPGVADVLVVGVPDPFLHEELCVCVLLETDTITMADVRQFVEKEVVTSEDNPSSPRPRYYLQFQSFPRSDTGKHRRFVIKAEATENLRKSEKPSKSL